MEGLKISRRVQVEKSAAENSPFSWMIASQRNPEHAWLDRFSILASQHLADDRLMKHP
jgi:hypothetical protein